MVTKTMSWILTTLLSSGQARMGYTEKIVVITIHSMKMSRTTVSRVHGIFFGSREIRIETSVTTATMYANGKS